MRKPIIIDCDPGVDDAIALFIAFKAPEIDLRGITTVAGNQTLDKTTRNALALVEAFDVDVKVARGSEFPLLREQVVAGYVHGVSGLKSLVLPEPKKQALPDAISFLYEEAKLAKGELEIVAVGPLTNIAQLFLIHPDVKPLIKRLTIMGGGHCFGNITPAAEFNFFADPEAAKVVFESEVDLVMVGLDVTVADGLDKKDIAALFTKPNKYTDIIQYILNDMVNAEGSGYKAWAYIHDAMALLTLFYPNMLGGGYYHVDIETKGRLGYGKSVVDLYGVTHKPANAFVALTVDSEIFHQAMNERLRVYES